MSTRVGQRAVIGFLTAENVIPTEIRPKAVYGDGAVRWVYRESTDNCAVTSPEKP